MSPRSARLAALLLLITPAVARADALDGLVFVAQGVAFVWALFALPMLGYAAFADLDTRRGRVSASVLLCLTWAPAVWFALAVEEPGWTMALGGLVVAGLLRIWRTRRAEAGD